MNALDLFSGIGGFRMALEPLGFNFIGYCEKDRSAQKVYESIFDTDSEWFHDDITKVEDSEWSELHGKIDIICAGFPCQSYSSMGTRKGLSDHRGSVFYSLINAIRLIEPSYLFFENVRGLVSKHSQEEFQTMLVLLEELGYDVEWQIINSSNFVPQHRERVFLIGHSRRKCFKPIFPIEFSNVKNTSSRLESNFLKIKEGTKRGFMEAQLFDYVNIANPNSKNIRGRVGKGISKTLVTLKQHCVVVPDPNDSNNLTLRYLTPRECWRLQGIEDHYFDIASTLVSENQLYKQAGNTVTIPIISLIGKKLKKL